MSLRLIEVVVPDSQRENIQHFLDRNNFLGTWCSSLDQAQWLVKILLYAKEAELAIDQLDEEFSHLDGFRLLLLSVEGALPRPDLLGSQTSEEQRSHQTAGQQNLPRINREELYTDIIASISISWQQNIMVVLSTLIAAVGLLQNSQTVLIGAMVIAPLLKPNMALAVATTLGDVSLGIRTLRTGTLGIGLAIALSAAIGYLFSVDPSLSEIAMRTDVHLTDVILALASGAAGALALTVGETSAVVGVMVSVALLPPLVAFGLLLGSGQWYWLFGSGMLVITNLVCLNLAAVIVLALQEVGPRETRYADQAKTATGIVITGWGLLLAGLVTAIILWKYQLP